MVAAGCVLASCGGTPAPHAAARTTTSSTTTTTTSVAPTTAVSAPQVVVPNVIGLKPSAARTALRGAGFTTVPLNAACSKGTLVSQSVVVSLSVPGRPPNVTVGAVPLAPGTPLTRGARVGITWSGCYPEGSTVPLVTGTKFGQAVRLLHAAGLEWACFSIAPPKTTTTTSAAATTSTTRPATTTSSTATTSTTTTTTTTTAATAAVAKPVVLSQGIPAGTVVRAGSVITFDMHHCPQ